MDDPAAYGELGGIFAGVVALLATIGGGIKWAVGWNDRRESTRSAKLDAWQNELNLREKRLADERAQFLAEIKGEVDELRRRDEQREAELTVIRAENAALRGSYHLVATSLKRISPDDPSLNLADELLRSAWPVDAATPDDLTKIILGARRSGEKD